MSRKRSAACAFLFLAALFAASFLLRFHAGDMNRRFESYTRDLFCQEVASNSISLHYTLRNPSAYGIEDAPVSLGSCTTDTGAVCASVENALAVLKSYDRSRLSEENRLTYDVLLDYYDTQLALAPYALYEEPLPPFTGTQSQLPVILSEYDFYNTSDIDTYLKLLTKIPDYFRSILRFEYVRAQKGLLMSGDSMQSAAEECEAFTRLGDDNYLFSSFEERLDEFSKTQTLSDSDRRKYIKKNKTYIKKYVFPAYLELAGGIRTICASADRTGGANARTSGGTDSKNGSPASDGTDSKNGSPTSGGLCSLPDGKRYYELLVASETGSSKSIGKLQEMTRKQIVEDIGGLQAALAKTGVPGSGGNDRPSPTSDLYSSQGSMLADSNPLSILNVLQEKMKNAFPEPPNVDVQVKYVQESIAEYLSPAFYMIPAIDSSKSNVIYINVKHLPDDLSLFTTLAHEGYPGHLYQNTYYMDRKPDPVRCLLDYGGYTEGWATYVEMMSYYYAPIPKEQAALMQKNTSIILGLYALTDMGIHYDGWTLTDTIDFFRDYGITDAEAVGEIYDIILLDPANYLKYYIGYLEFLELKKDAIRLWGDDFTQKRFHKTVLETGPASFKILLRQIKRRRG